MTDYCEHCGQSIEDDMAGWKSLCELAKQDTVYGRLAKRQVEEKFKSDVILLKFLSGDFKGKPIKFAKYKPLESD